MRTFVIAITACLVCWGQTQGAVIHQYRLDGSLADDFAGPSLVSLGGSLGPSTYAFGANQGLSLSGGLASPGVYSIELRFEFDETLGWQKVIDFQNLVNDHGLYVQGTTSTTGNAYFWNYGAGGTFLANTFHTVVLTRDASGILRTYIDGMQVSAFNDAGNQWGTSPGNILRFFRDDNATGGNEATSGTVDYIRIYDNALTAGQVAALQPPTVNAVPEPASVIAWAGFSALSMVVLRRRNKA